ncbi:LOW QUALITY PROTEIN: proteasome activator complex subunit 4-like [Uloborus diversus]|uniref:LOW QUALITY PROTEIN: proteasome activator complex subunit 4-like n=1 Tax=Uloborus diversus TaxID=327109 RepID=UPI002409723B|nr:LOW QUALITY PROTEIN: proteasome activator complex subunit 4-like [Uloborus diversus]
MDDRVDILGFVPQKELIYNKLLPYTEKLDNESQIYLSEIKTNLGKSVLSQNLDDISFWCKHLLRYISLYGRKFSKEDHISFINVLFELLLIPDVELTFVDNIAVILNLLLKKSDLLSRDDLVLPWRTLYQLFERLYLSLSENIEYHLKSLIRSCRLYFSVDSTQEILDEFRPYMCPFDSGFARVVNYFESLLCTTLPPSEHDKGFRLWFDELMTMWQQWHNIPGWENGFLWLFSRVAKDNIGYINWEPYMPMIFTRLLRSFNLPGRSNQVQVLRVGCAFDTTAVATLIASMLGSGSSCQLHISRLFKALESFYHPSNHGRWLGKMQRLLQKLPVAVIKRIRRERYTKKVNFNEIPEEAKLTNEDITEFVKSIVPAALLSMFSKRGCLDSATALQNLGALRPEIVIPPLLERLYSSLETLIEPHRLTASMHCLLPVSRALVRKNKYFLEGPSHVIPLLMAALPGIDPNDIKKCMVTFQFISTFVTLVLLVDCSSAAESNPDLPPNVQELCLATAAFEDFVLQFMDRCFVLIENSCLDNPSRLDRDSERTNPEENFLEVGLNSTFGIIVSQSSPEIYEVILSKLHNFITTHILEVNVSGKYAANMCRAASKVNPKLCLKAFVPHFTKLILTLTENDDVLNEEVLDDELLFSLLVLSEVVRSDGQYLLEYHKMIETVLERTLYLKCKKGYRSACQLLFYALKTYIQSVPKESRSVANAWSRYSPEEKYRYLDDWGEPGDINNLGVEYHVPSEDELKAVKSLLEKFLFPELDKLQKWASKELVLSRDSVQQSLNIVLHCLVGASEALPLWPAEQLPRHDSSLPVYSPVPLDCGNKEIDFDGKNVRLLICDVMRKVLNHITECCEDDTKSLFLVIKLYHSLMFNWGVEKDDLDGRFKAFRLVKNALENKLYGKKKHMRSLLIDRTHLQHELRLSEKYRHYCTEVHYLLMKDLLQLSTSHYSEVRIKAQIVLHNCLNTFHQSYKVIFPKVLELLQKDPTECHEEFKGVLHVIVGQKRSSLLFIQCWESLSKLWPLIVSSKHSEKPSIIKLLESIIVIIHKHLPTIQIKLKFSEKCLKAAESLFNQSMPLPTAPSFTSDEILTHTKNLQNRNEKNESCYRSLVFSLIELLQNNNLHWRHYRLALEMLSILIRPDVVYPKEGVELFVGHLIHETLAIRKISLQAVVCILKQHKRKHVKIEIDPKSQQSEDWTLHPLMAQQQTEDIPDNLWLQYNSLTPPNTLEKWKSRHFVHKSYVGFYAWPKQLKVHAPESEQPKLDRTFDELQEEEKPIYEAFMQQTFVDNIVSYFSLEEKKGVDKFCEKKLLLFRNLFSNFGDTFLPNFVHHLHQMVEDKQESMQRCATEMIGGILNASKHWGFEKVEKLKENFVPILEKALKSITPETFADWAKCFASMIEDRDPNKYYWLFEFLMKEPQSIENGSFLESSWLFILAETLATQQWRVNELFLRVLEYIKPKLNHSYQNVREKIANLLVNIFMYDIPVNGNSLVYAPKRLPFLNEILPKFAILDTKDGNFRNELTSSGEESAERKDAKNLFRTICLWISLNSSRTLAPAPPDIFKILPLLCHLQNDSTDESFQRECSVAIAILGHALLSHESINVAVKSLQEIVSNNSWHSRAAAAAYLQQMVFSNLFSIMCNDKWTATIHEMLLTLLQDERIEVRESAAETLCGFLHCEYFKISEEFLNNFKVKCQKKLKRHKAYQNGPRSIEPDELRERHAGILGLCACVNAFPYDVPDFLPDILVLLADHLHDPQPIEATIKKTLSSFRRTHYDNWRDHKLKFTDDQLAVITDLLVSPSYYA